MAKLAALLRVQALGAFGLNAAIRSTDVRRRMTLTGMALLFVLVGVVMAVYCYATGAAMASVGAASSVPSFAVFAGSCAAAAASLLKAGGALFGFKDYDTVMALPVPTWQVVLSRLASLYAMAALLCAVLMVPLYVASLPAAGVGVAGWLAALLSMVLVPAIPLALAVAVAFLVSLVASRMRHAQAVAGIAGLALVVALVVAMGGLSQPSSALGGDAQAALGQAVASFAAFASGLWLPAGWVQAAVIQGQPLALALFAAASVACATLCVAVVSRFFEQLNAAVSSPASSRGRRATFGQQPRNPVQALVEKELRLVLSTPIYLMNMGIGPVLGFAVGCACFAAAPSLLSTVAESLPAGAGALGSVTRFVARPAGNVRAAAPQSRAGACGKGVETGAVHAHLPHEHGHRACAGFRRRMRVLCGGSLPFVDCCREPACRRGRAWLRHPRRPCRGRASLGLRLLRRHRCYQLLLGVA